MPHSIQNAGHVLIPLLTVAYDGTSPWVRGISVGFFPREGFFSQSFSLAQFKSNSDFCVSLFMVTHLMVVAMDSIVEGGHCERGHAGWARN